MCRSGVGAQRACEVEEKACSIVALISGRLFRLSIDYRFFGSPGETPLKTVAGKDLPVLVGCDRKAKAVLAHPAPREGLQKEGHVDEYPVKVIVRDLNRLGCEKVDGKSDQENAILAVCNAVEVLWKGEWIQEKAPERDPGTKPSDGEVERAVQTVRG
jgi:hypothetical protein